MDSKNIRIIFIYWITSGIRLWVFCEFHVEKDVDNFHENHKPGFVHRHPQCDAQDNHRQQRDKSRIDGEFRSYADINSPYYDHEY